MKRSGLVTKKKGEVVEKNKGEAVETERENGRVIEGTGNKMIKSRR